MIFYVKEKHNRHFKENLQDWFLGGPKEGGWTRTGSAITPINVNLASYSRQIISVDDALSKNKFEIKKWHLDFLDGKPQAYFSEYLDPRYDEIQANERARTFLDLLEHMRENGFDEKYPVCIVDVSELELGFKYFRFDGCHRLCCAKHLGINEVPCHLFSIEVLAKI